MPYLYLIRHPKTEPDPGIPASKWRLSREGFAQVRRLVTAPFWNGVTAVYTSRETKAAAVGAAIQVNHNIPFIMLEDLREARRDEWVGLEAFRAAQQAFFARPGEPPIPTWESAGAAQVRFAGAMQDILARHPESDSLAVVAHATVLTLYIARLRGEVPGYGWWSRIGFAEVMAVDRATQQPVTSFLAAPYEGLPLP
ncbi:MAG: histidine phosphatase family protein [Anaerolineae bacterium]|nr:histidine phosphatase family protein [Anaerolineae bacterium]